MPQGKYPDQTLDEIWFGSQSEKIRSEMRGSRFPEGCGVCSSEVYAGNYGQMRLNLYEQYAVSPFEKTMMQFKNGLKTGKFSIYPKVMSFELSNRCNLECVMCLGLLSSSIRKNREKLPPLPELYDTYFVEQLKPYIPHLEEAKFFGGEPFLIDIYLDIWEAFTELNPSCKIYITTNGTILNNRVRNILEKLPNFQMVISLDAIRKETYEKIRVNASYERVMENLQYFKQVSEKHQRHLIISPTFMIHNWEEYPEILEFANKNNIYFETNLLTTPRELALCNQNPETLKNVLNRWEPYLNIKDNENRVLESNLREFNKAYKQVEFMLEDQIKYYASETGNRLNEFMPSNKLEWCMYIIYSHSVRSIKDPSVPLKLLELWKSDSNLFADFFQAVQRFGVEIFKQKPEQVKNFSESIEQAVLENFGPESSENFIKRLFNDEMQFISFLNHVKELNYTPIKHIIQQKTADTRIPVEADFF